MSRLIIENQAGIDDGDALYYAMKVVKQGRISENGAAYCFATTFVNGVAVYAKRNKASDTLIIRKGK